MTNQRREANSSSKLIPRNIFIYASTLILIQLSFITVNHALQCLVCSGAHVTCDDSTHICTHNCTSEETCVEDDSYIYGATCFAAIYDTHFVRLDCFPKYEETRFFCFMADGETCACSRNNCNAKLLHVMADIPSEGEEFLLPTVSNRSNEFINISTTDHTKEQPPEVNWNVTKSFPEKKDSNSIYLLLILLATTACVVMAISAISFILIKVRQRKADVLGTMTSNTDSTSLDLGQDCSDSKALGGTPPMSPSISVGTHLNLHLEEVVGRGRFGAVWRAEWKMPDGKESTVAVKVFYEFDSTSWNVEKDLFNDPNVVMQHENIVKYINAEVRQITYPQPQRQYWIITQYHPVGSLQEYLAEHTVSWEQFCQLACSTARGVAHLHADVFYEDLPMMKYPVAHRDLKSCNVLVKNDGTCVIADFGLALKLDPRATEQDLANSGQVGTPRYMPPEALECKVNLQNIESFKQIDVYSLSLIVWEIARRCTVLSDVPDYELPYTEQLCDQQPTLDEMRSIVSHRRERPIIPDTWNSVTGMIIVSKTITECWDEDSEARLTASCIETRFSQFVGWEDGEQCHGDCHPTTII